MSSNSIAKLIVAHKEIVKPTVPFKQGLCGIHASVLSMRSSLGVSLH